MFFMPCCSFDHLGKIIMKYLLNKKFHETCTGIVVFSIIFVSPCSALRASVSFVCSPITLCLFHVLLVGAAVDFLPPSHRLEKHKVGGVVWVRQQGLTSGENGAGRGTGLGALSSAGCWPGTAFLGVKWDGLPLSSSPLICWTDPTSPRSPGFVSSLSSCLMWRMWCLCVRRPRTAALLHSGTGCPRTERGSQSEVLGVLQAAIGFIQGSQQGLLWAHLSSKW